MVQKVVLLSEDEYNAISVQVQNILTQILYLRDCFSRTEIKHSAEEIEKILGLKEEY